MTDSRHWWEQFCHNNSSDLQMKEIIDSINRLEKDLNKDEMLILRDLIDQLDPEIYNEQIRSLEKKYNILENRVERQISDDFGVLLKYLRKKKGLSLAKLAELTGISPSYINRLELKQRKSPSINIMESLANALDVPLAVLAKAAGINFNNHEVYPITDLIHINMVSLKPYGEALTGIEKEKIIKIIEILTADEYDHLSEEELLKEVHSFRNIIESNNIKSV